VTELIVFYFNPSSCRASPLMSKMSKIDFARLPDHHIFTGYGGHGLLYVYVLATFLSRFIFLGCSYLEFTKYEYNVSKYLITFNIFIRL
jgi:hypothetical protein